MNRKFVIPAIGVVFLALALSAWSLYLSNATREKFGAAPLIGFAYDEPMSLASGKTCQRVAAVSPPHHWNLLGEMWQEDAIDWEDVQTLSPAPQKLEHGRTGPVRVGDIVCGWVQTGWKAAIYTPTGDVLYCGSHEEAHAARPYYEPCAKRKWP